jgi:hypothetical protein
MNISVILLTLAVLVTGVPNREVDFSTERPGPTAFIDETKEVETSSPFEGGGINGKGTHFTRKNKEIVKKDNARRHEGKNHCENCGVETVPGQQHQKGVTPPDNEAQVDHITPKVKGGQGVPENGQILCRECNLKKSDKEP